VHFAILRPPPSAYERQLKSNAMSCVLRVRGSQRSALLTGDIEREQEAALVAELGTALRSDVLIAPHHGSKTSSTAALLDAVAPETAVFQAGYRSRFGHPAAEVLAAYRERAIAIRTSPACGAWTWTSAADTSPTCERALRRRYWHHAPDPGAVPP
jgi:competence protein ComEC